MLQVVIDLQEELERNYDRLSGILDSGKVVDLHMEVNYIAAVVGDKHGLGLSINFPQMQEMDDVLKGRRNLSIIIDSRIKKFNLPVDEIKAECLRMIEGSTTEDFENGDGFHLLFRSDRISIFPGSVHVWGKVSDAEKLLDFLFSKVYASK